MRHMGVATLFSELYVPALVLPLMILFVVRSLHHNEVQRLQKELDQSQNLGRQRERERDLAQEELFRRLYEERELNKEKLQFQAQLAEYEKYAALAQLALGAAHEINNPLLGMLSHLELELKDTHDPERRQEIEQCIVGARRISSTLRGLVDYARPTPPVLSRISLSRLIADTIILIEHQPMLRNKLLSNRVPSDLPPYVPTPISSLSSLHGASNAEATPEGGTISISANQLTYVDNLEIRVADTGSGIPPDVLPHVFKPFFTTKRGKGTGLGLSISHAYIRIHNCEIRVDSVVNHGTTVTITLPLHTNANAEDNKEESQMVV
jgi:signal transduction histidine kinase